MKFILIAVSMFQTHVSANEFSVSADYFRGEGDVEGVKFGAQLYSDYLKQFTQHAELYFESSFNLWEYGANDRRDSNFVIAVSPVILYPFAEGDSSRWFVEFGIGLSILSDTKFAGKDVGSHFQFEDRVGVVMRFGNKRQHHVALRYFHYSNAGLAKPNPGLDFISLSYSMRFH